MKGLEMTRNIIYNCLTSEESSKIRSEYDGTSETIDRLECELGIPRKKIINFANRHGLGKRRRRESEKWEESAKKISDAQQIVLDELYTGKSLVEISKKLNLAITTVKTHVHCIYSKCDVNSRLELLAKRIKELEQTK